MTCHTLPTSNSVGTLTSELYTFRGSRIRDHILFFSIELQHGRAPGACTRTRGGNMQPQRTDRTEGRGQEPTAEQETGKQQPKPPRKALLKRKASLPERAKGGLFVTGAVAGFVDREKCKVVDSSASCWNSVHCWLGPSLLTTASAARLLPFGCANSNLRHAVRARCVVSDGRTSPAVFAWRKSCLWTLPAERL